MNDPLLDPNLPASIRRLAERDPDGVRHSLRFRRVSNRYPNMVAQAYDRDLAAAAAASDEEVAARVRAWEVANGWPVRDWVAIGAAERDDDR